MFHTKKIIQTIHSQKHTQKFWLILLVMTVMLAAASCDDAKPKIVLLMPFTNQDQSKDTANSYEFLSLGLADEIGNKLNQSPQIEIIDQYLLLRQLSFAQTTALEKKQDEIFNKLKKIEMEPDFYITGQFLVEDKGQTKDNQRLKLITLQAQVRERKSKKVVAEAKRSGDMRQWFHVRGLLAIDLAEKMGAPLTDKQKEQLKAANTNQFLAFQKNYEGKMYYYRSLSYRIKKENQKAEEMRNKANFYFHKARSLDNTYKEALKNWGQSINPKDYEQKQTDSKTQLAQYQLNSMVIYAFEYKKNNVHDMEAWADQFLPYLKSLINRLPAGHYIEIQGHADASGPEQPTRYKKGNIYWSEVRAKMVYDILVRKGLSPNRLKVKGYGSSQTIPWIKDRKHPAHRRVTFAVKS